MMGAMVATETAPSPGDPRKGSLIKAEGISVYLGGNKVLSSVSASFLPSRITAILGPSGSGKSTLIKCLATVLNPSRGVITVDGEKLAKVRDALRPQLGYVPQDDVIHRELRVRQAFAFAARLRLDEELPRAAREQRIASITTQLGLDAHRGKRVGRLSGGQRKRVNIGIELIADPRVLLLDEPASGLDPATEEDLLRVLRALAEEGRTVVLTTHSMEYLDRVDRILVLMEGAPIFYGTLAGMLGHFQIPHPAEVFKVIRGQRVEHWVGRSNVR